MVFHHFYVVHNVAIEGSFDDCQDIVKELFSDKEFKEKYKLGAINSINWARILAQTTYYFYSFFSVLKQMNVPGDVASYLSLQKIQFSVPSGNFGDVLAGFFAKQMGLPIHHFIVATNENDILDRFLKTGSYQKQFKTDSVDPVKQTLSPAMDILISSNFERLLWYLVANGQTIPNTPSDNEASHSCDIISQYMIDLREKGGFTVDASVLNLAKSLFSSDRVDDATTSAAIKRYYHNQFNDNDAKGYILDPHTAVGVVAAEIFLKSSQNSIQTVCLSTASPGKFPDAVLNAINLNPPDLSVQMGFKPVVYKDIAPRALVALDGLPQRMTLVRSGGKYEKALDGVRMTVVETLSNRSGKL
jgi:threonine synthase